MGVEEWVTGEEQRGMREGCRGTRQPWVCWLHVFSGGGASCIGACLSTCPLDVRLSYCIHISVKLLNNKTDPSRINPAYAWLATQWFKLSFEEPRVTGLTGLEVEVRVEGACQLAQPPALLGRELLAELCVQFSGVPSLLNSWATRAGSVQSPFLSPW